MMCSDFIFMIEAIEEIVLNSNSFLAKDKHFKAPSVA